jgi:tRNA(adenine34) deaminase
MTDHAKFMAIAIAEAKTSVASGKGDQPFGAVVVVNDEVVVRTPSLKVSTCDTTAHSETLAIKLASQKLGRREFPEAIFYATCEPCPMCLGAIQNAAINTLVIGARHRHMPEIVGFHNYTVERFAEMCGWKLNVIEGVLQDECVAMYKTSLVPVGR